MSTAVPEKIFVFGDAMSRGWKSEFKTALDTSLVFKYLELVKQFNSASSSDERNKIGEEIDTLLDDQEFDVSTALSIMVFSLDQDNISALIEEIKQELGFYSCGEEELFGYGPTKHEAKQQYRQGLIEYELDDDQLTFSIQGMLE